MARKKATPTIDEHMEDVLNPEHVTELATKLFASDPFRELFVKIHEIVGGLSDADKAEWDKIEKAKERAEKKMYDFFKARGLDMEGLFEQAQAVLGISDPEPEPELPSEPEEPPAAEPSPSVATHTCASGNPCGCPRNEGHGCPISDGYGRHECEPA